MFEVKVPANPGKLSPAAGIAILLVLSFLNYLTKQRKKPSVWIILDIWALQNFISVDILLAKAFLFLVVYLVARNNSCVNSSSSTFFLLWFYNLQVASCELRVASCDFKKIS